MRRLLKIGLVVLGVITASVLILLTPARHHTITSYQPVAEAFLPGHRLPPHMACQTSYYLEDPLHLYCQPVGEDRADNVFVTYDRLGKVIVDTDILNPQETAGDLLLAWGNPVGYQQQALGRYLYWPGRYVYIGGLEFSPDAKVGFIVYDDTATAHDAWRGFTN